MPVAPLLQGLRVTSHRFSPVRELCLNQARNQTSWTAGLQLNKSPAVISKVHKVLPPLFRMVLKLILTSTSPYQLRLSHAARGI